MKARAFGRLLQITEALAHRESSAVVALAKIFSSAPATATASAIINKLAGAAELSSPAEAEDEDFGTTLPTLGHVKDIVEVTSTAAVIAHVENLIGLARDYAPKSVASIASYLSAPTAPRRPARPRTPKVTNSEAIERHSAELLRRAPGTPAFGSALDALATDSEIKLAELKAIAMRLGVEFTDSTKRPTLLKKIGAEHKVATDAIAKANALKGNSSA